MTGDADGGQQAPRWGSRVAPPGTGRPGGSGLITVDADGGQQARRPALRIHADPESAERGLAGLVLTVVELLRQLMERQAIRRIDAGGLTDDQVEQLGTTLMLLEERMAELREHFGLSPEDLNIDLGPLGPLLPTD